MAAHAVHSGLGSPHLVTPVVRCLSSVRPRDAHDTQPVRFCKFLLANRLDRPGDTFELSKVHEHPQRAEQPGPLPLSTPLLPKIGEIIDVQPRPKVAVHETNLYQQLNPATGHALDIYA